ncbi:type II toxin-antitoxin system HicB family antitoxin [Thermococcus chitonophagus]|uniref:HicB-like antitoxin of toxin-antitoxin system domain-containing protein n=1 Tax=Thermococcus chitonophagus TaxID=54262 RepID=A0A160VV92_9EURY|nr:type II toxin-antitoxin system HicB family antitoxin [Thermococcus chitonophagus]CUX77641.1 hypothetical protein CHITON_0862 [Thermococcus chitonophagus]
MNPKWRGYVAYVPELPGCLSQGEIGEEALKNIRRGDRAVP